MHAGKRWTHAATRPMRQNPKSPKSQIGEWDSWELEARPIQNDAPREKCEFYTLFGLALHSFCRSAASLPSSRVAGCGCLFSPKAGGACLVMIPQVRVLRAALWRSLSSEGVPLRCGLQTWGLLCEVCVVLCSGRGRDTVSLVTRGNSVFVAANRVLKRGRSENDVVLRKTLCCEARPHLPDKKDKAGRKRVTWPEGSRGSD